MLPAFYVEHFDANMPCLSESEGHHAHRVLRLKVGGELRVLDGHGGSYKCRLLAPDAGQYPLEFLEQETVHAPQPVLWLYVAPPKQRHRLDFLVEKAAELGVRRLTFIQTARTERRRLRLDKLTHITIAALKQSGQPYKLMLAEGMPFAVALKEATAACLPCVLATLSQHRRLRSAENWPRATAGRPAALFIGPAGGFDNKEHDMAEAAGAQLRALGLQTTLRTETAAVVGAMRWLIDGLRA